MSKKHKIIILTSAKATKLKIFIFLKILNSQFNLQRALLVTLQISAKTASYHAFWNKCQVDAVSSHKRTNHQFIISVLFFLTLLIIYNVFTSLHVSQISFSFHLRVFISSLTSSSEFSTRHLFLMQFGFSLL